MELDRKIRFGVMLDGDAVEQWQFDTVKMLIDNGIELSLIIKNGDDSKPYKSFGDKVLHYPYRQVLFRVWHRYFFKPEAKRRVSLTGLFDLDRINKINKIGSSLSFRPERSGAEKSPTIITVTPIIKGISTYFKPEDIEKIRSFDLDFILRFGFDIIRGEVLTAARYGVWSYHHDDERVVRGGPPGFWEFMRKIPKNGVILQQLTDELDKGLILKRIQFDTVLHSYKSHLNRLLTESEFLPLQVAKELIVNGKLEPELSQSKAPIMHPPKNFQMLRYFWLCIWRKVVFHWNYYFRQEDWNVGYCFEAFNDFIEADLHPSLQWLKPPKTDYFADPFVISNDKDTYLFFEWFSNKNGKADLAVAKKSENFEIYHKITDFPEHRSYPFVFDYQGDIYCIPEANKTNKVALYRFDETDSGPSLQWDCDLLQGRFVDTTLFVKDNKFYLFTTPQNEPHTHLLLFVADDLRGPYRPHFNNPVKVDCCNSRMAGKIQNIDGELVRPAQNSTSHYGESITLNKIIHLDEYQYIEETIKEIKPDKKWTYNKGIHTINSDGGITVFDAKKFTFTLTGFWQQLRQKFL